MKTIKIVLALCFLSLGVSNIDAQLVRNFTTCTYEVKSNWVTLGTCPLTGNGPVTIVGPGAVTLPIPPPTLWNVAYGVKKLPVGMPRVVGESNCYPTVRAVGFCDGVLVRAYFLPGGDLDIN